MSGMMMAMLGSKGGGAVSDYNGSSVYDYNPASGIAIANITFNTDGTVSGSVRNQASPDTITISGNWHNPTGGAPGNSYWIKGTVTGDTPSGPTGSYTSLGTSQTFSLSATSELLFCSIVVKIYSDSGGINEVASGTVTLEAEDV